ITSTEVDVNLIAMEMQLALESHAIKIKERRIKEVDGHMFLVLDRNVQGIPWESIPILRGRSVSRIPSLDFLLDRLHFASWKKESDKADRAVVDATKVYYVLNPSGDLQGTEGRFRDWLKQMHCVGWEGIVG